MQQHPLSHMADAILDACESTLHERPTEPRTQGRMTRRNGTSGDEIAMQNASAEVLKLKPVLDLGSRGRVSCHRASTVGDDATNCVSMHPAVKIITTPCVQIILSAVKSSGGVSVVSPSEEFTSAFADLGLTFPQTEPIEMPPPAAGEPTDASADPADARTMPTPRNRCLIPINLKQQPWPNEF